jgi:hypothetical protein
MNTLVHFGLTTYSNGSCNGTAAVVISGGTSSFTYNWSNGMSIGAIDGLCAGEYCVSVSDANACSASNCVTIVNPAVLSVSISSTNVSCNGM